MKLLTLHLIRAFFLSKNFSFYKEKVIFAIAKSFQTYAINVEDQREITLNVIHTMRVIFPCLSHIEARTLFLEKSIILIH